MFNLFSANNKLCKTNKLYSNANRNANFYTVNQTKFTLNKYETPRKWDREKNLVYFKNYLMRTGPVYNF